MLLEKELSFHGSRKKLLRDLLEPQIDLELLDEGVQVVPEKVEESLDNYASLWTKVLAP